MKLLLKEDVEGLGICGDEVTVKDGYGRNYLIPKGRAILATPKNIKQFNHQKMIVQGKLKKIIGSADALRQRIEKITCTVRKKVGEQGKLYGSVTTQEIADLLRKNGVEVDKRKIQPAEPIRSLGEFKVPIKLHPQVVAQIHVAVIQDAVAEEAETVSAPETKAAGEDAETAAEPETKPAGDEAEKEES